jgi:hypothetical protein
MLNIFNSINAQMMAELEADGDRPTSRVSAAKFTTLLLLGIAIIAVYTIPHPSTKTPRIQSTTIQK